MIYLGVLLGIGILAAVIYMALNKKSDIKTRIASMAALALMIITVIICLVLVFTDNRVPIDESVLIVGAPVEVRKDNENTGPLLLLIVFLIALFFLIGFLAIREHKKSKSPEDTNLFKRSPIKDW